MMNAHRGKRILIVEDEIMIAMLVEEMLVDLGFEVAGHALTADEAAKMIKNNVLDGAVLDVNLGGQSRSTTVAESLEELGIPFIFVTGYGLKGSPEAFRSYPVLKKPFSFADFKAKVEALFG